MMEFPAQLAHIGDPEGGAGDSGHPDLPGRQPAEGVVAQVGVGEWAEHLSGRWACHGQDGPLVGHVGDGHRLSGPDVIDKPVPVVGATDQCRVEVEAVVGQPGDRHLAFDAA